jgi:hypothetical protein
LVDYGAVPALSPALGGTLRVAPTEFSRRSLADAISAMAAWNASRFAWEGF